MQHRVSTPVPVWNPDLPDDNDYLAQWTDVPDTESYGNGFKAQWELFLAHAAQGKPSAGTWRRVRAAFSWPSWRCGRRPRARASTCPRWRREMTAAVRLPGRPEPVACRIRRGPAPTPPALRSVYAAAHVAARPDGTIDWEATLGFRDYLWAHGFGVAEAMDTAQRGMGLSWEQARELIERSAGRRGGRARRGDRLRGGHRPARPAARTRWTRSSPRTRSSSSWCRRRRPGHPDGQPGARGERRKSRRLPGGVQARAGPGRPAGHPALAGRRLRSRAARLLGKRGLRRRRRHGHRADQARGGKVGGIKLSVLDADQEVALRSGCRLASACSPATISTTPT